MEKEFELKPEDLEEEIEVTIHKDAFRAGELHCDNCNKKMDKVSLDVEIPGTSLVIRLESFRCGKCGKEYLNGEQAEKLDRALAVSKAITRKGVVYERAEII